MNILIVIASWILQIVVVGPHCSNGLTFFKEELVFRGSLSKKGKLQKNACSSFDHEDHVMADGGIRRPGLGIHVCRISVPLGEV